MVPSTVKCSSESNSLVRANSSTAAKNSSAISPPSKRSRFLVKVVASQTRSSIFNPTKQQVVLQLLHQHPFTAHRVKHLQQQGSQQPLGRDRRSARPRIQLVKARRQLLKDLISHLPHGPQRMIRRHSLFRHDVAVHRTLVFVFSPHSVPPSLTLDQIIVDRDLRAGNLFSFS